MSICAGGVNCELGNIFSWGFSSGLKSLLMLITSYLLKRVNFSLLIEKSRDVYIFIFFLKSLTVFPNGFVKQPLLMLSKFALLKHLLSIKCYRDFVPLKTAKSLSWVGEYT